MFLNRQSPTVRLITTLIVAAWLTVCGQSCAEAGVGLAGEPTLAGAAHTGGEGTALPTGAAVLHAASHIPRHGVNDPGCDGSACCAKIAISDHGKQETLAATLVPLPPPATVLYTVPVAALSRLAPPAARPKSVPHLTPLKITGILRI